ncbi:MAG TPA: hypothetical protein ENK17_01255 [Anaerolineae bacterium]|nr:hypothetical protein [Anaerolineae bacterium]
MAQSYLQAIAYALDTLGFEAQALPLEVDGKQTEHLVVHLLTDDRGRDVFAQLLFLSNLEEVIGPAVEEIEDGEGMDLLQVYAALPFDYEAEAVPHLARLMLAMNRYLPINGFGLDEELGILFCRHVLFCPGGDVDVRVLVEVLDSMAFFIEEYGGVLEPVANGSGSLAEALAAVSGQVAV